MACSWTLRPLYEEPKAQNNGFLEFSLILRNFRETLKQSLMSPHGEAIQDGYLQERLDGITAPHSAYSYEDLPTDRFAADFGANFFDPNNRFLR